MKNLSVGQKFDLGNIVFSEQEIIDFAKAFDPLDFHIDKTKAEKTIFKGLIASGPHLFNHIYRKEWIPRFGSTVICGLGISNWKFIKPLYPDQAVVVSLSVLTILPDKKIKGKRIKWLFEFENKQNEMIQVLEMTVLHHS